MGEGSSEKVRRRKFVGEGSLDKVRGRRSEPESGRKVIPCEVVGKLVIKMVEKVALIPCEEKK